MPRIVAALAAVLLPAAAVLAQQRVVEDFQLGLGLQQRGLHEEAERCFDAFLRAAPQHARAPEAHYRRAVSLLALEQREPAVQALRQALQQGGPGFELRFEARYRLSQALHEGGDHGAAAEQLDGLQRELPADHYLQAAVQYATGECRRDLGDDDAALQHFVRAASAGGENSPGFRFPALYQAGFASLRLGRFAAAATHFAAAHEAAPDDASRHETAYLAGDAQLRAGAPAAALPWLQRAQQDPAAEFADDAALALGFCALAQRDAEAALSAFRACLQRHSRSPLLPRARLEIGRLLYERRDFAAAERELAAVAGCGDAALELAARELLGLCALARGKGGEAVPALRAALAAAPESERARLSFALAEALVDAGDHTAALPCYEQAAALAGGDGALRGDALYGACFALHTLGSHDKSSQRAAALRDELPQHRLVPLATFAIAENRFEQRQFAAAAAEYAKVPEGSEVAPQAAGKLAWCRYLLGDHADAARRFAAIAKTRGHPNAEEALAMQALAEFEAGQHEAALATADAYRARHPQGSYLDRTERIAGRVLRQRGDLAGAAQRFERAGQRSADSGPDQLERAEVQFQRGDYRGAAGLYEQLAVRSDAVGARALEGLCWCAFELGDDHACAERLQRAARHPAAAGLRPALLELESALYHRQKNWPAAILVGEAFLRDFGGHAKAPAMRYALGVAQARGGEVQAAQRTLQALVEQGGYERMDRVHYELGWAARRSGDEAAALRAFAVAAGSADQDLAGEARLHVGAALLAAGDHARARQELLQVEGRFRGRALYELAAAEFAAAASDGSRLRAAQQGFDAVAAIAGEALVPEALFLAADCCRRSGDHQGAAERLERLLQLAPQHERSALARLSLAETAVELGDGERAVRRGAEFLAGGPDERTARARAHLAVGRGRQLRNDHERAESEFVRVTELSDGPLAAEAQFRIGESRAARGDLRGAVDAHLKLSILHAEPEWVARGLLQAGLCNERLGQRDKALKLWRELVDRFPDTTEAAAARARLDPR